MFYNIGRFLGLIREEPTGLEVIMNFIATNKPGIISGLCAGMIISVLAYLVYCWAWKRIRKAFYQFMITPWKRKVKKVKKEMKRKLQESA